MQMIDCNGGGIGTGWRNYYRGSLLSVLLRYNLHVVMVGRTNRFGNGNRMVNFQFVLHPAMGAWEDIIARGNRLVAETSRAFCVTVEPCGRCPVLLAELWAIHDGLAQAWMRGYRHVEIEPNSLEVVRLVSSASIEMQEYGLVLSIKRWISHDWQVRVQHVSHGHNNVAYKLAAKGRRLEFTNSSFVMILGDVEDLVAKERERSTPARVRSGNFVDFPYDLGGS
ncbi:hypothetical protein V6N13_130059 [Hibiscus sabdariffa]